MVVISDGYWTRRFHNDPAVDRPHESLINDVKMTIIGVAPPAFTGEIVGVVVRHVAAGVGCATRSTPTASCSTTARRACCSGLGRLKPGATLARAKQELTPLIKAVDRRQRG